jgi:hypothetical protein
MILDEKGKKKQHGICMQVACELAPESCYQLRSGMKTKSAQHVCWILRFKKKDSGVMETHKFLFAKEARKQAQCNLKSWSIGHCDD